MLDNNWNEVSYAISSDNRRDVLMELYNGASTPSRIAEQTNIRMSHVSRALDQLEERGHVELLVSESKRKGRIYNLTPSGEQISKRIKENDL